VQNLSTVLTVCKEERGHYLDGIPMINEGVNSKNSFRKKVDKRLPEWVRALARDVFFRCVVSHFRA
jgi:hypothetical protein